MKKYKYIILGAGPAGLSFANALKQRNDENFIVIEKEGDAGGLCRSRNIDEAPIDIGGGHFLDVCRPDVNSFLFQFMPKDEWNLFDRHSCIHINGTEIGHPFESNIWQMSQEMQILYIKSIAIAGCNLGVPKPERFIDWVRWKLGDLIAEQYMIPYNYKMFGEYLDELGTYWLEKLPDVSVEETLLSCLNKKPYGKEPGHTKFYYPKRFGYGELWMRMASQIDAHIRYKVTVDRIDFNNTSVKLSDGSEIAAEYIIMTIPWTSVPEYIGMPSNLTDSIRKLKYTSINVSYIPEKFHSNAQWIYYPDINVSYHRILIRSNFIHNSKGYWTETNVERAQKDKFKVFCNEYAYPVNTIEKPNIMSQLLAWCSRRCVVGLGRWGEWEHFNSDITVERALKLASEIK